MRVDAVDDLGESVGRIWRQSQSKHGFQIAAPLSSTPLPIYEWVARNADSFSHWDSARFVLMDEQVDTENGNVAYVDDADSASYEGFARRHLLDPLARVAAIELPVIKPELSRIASFRTPIDLLILAIGPSGNYANVMPGTPMETGWHIAELSDEFRTVHTGVGSHSYAGATFRTHGMSLGPQQVLDAGQVLVIASGAKKKPLVDQLLAMSTFDAQFPISIVHDSRVSRRVRCIFVGVRCQ